MCVLMRVCVCVCVWVHTARVPGCKFIRCPVIKGEVGKERSEEGRKEGRKEGKVVNIFITAYRLLRSVELWNTGEFLEDKHGIGSIVGLECPLLCELFTTPFCVGHKGRSVVLLVFTCTLLSFLHPFHRSLHPQWPSALGSHDASLSLRLYACLFLFPHLSSCLARSLYPSLSLSPSSLSLSLSLLFFRAHVLDRGQLTEYPVRS